MLVGVSGTIYQLHALEALQKLGISRANTRSCASKLHEQAIKHMHSIVTTKHALAHSNSQHTQQSSGHNRPPNPNPH